MIHMNITSFRKNIFNLLEQTIKWGEPLNIVTKTGNAVVLSEDEYNGLIETLYINSNPTLKNIVEDGLKTPLAECVAEDAVRW
ncbi:MAG: type II toxin-antitoxin system Phd/YefM family antitoxin [Eubacteriales bacterium]